MTSKKRSFTPKYKAECVALLLNDEKSIPSPAKDLDSRKSALRTWVLQSKTDERHGDAKGFVDTRTLKSGSGFLSRDNADAIPHTLYQINRV